MSRWRWEVTVPQEVLNRLDLSKQHELGCYDTDCLISTLWVDNMADEVEDELEGGKIISTKQLPHFGWQFTFTTASPPEKVRKRLEKYEDGHYRTSRLEQMQE